jgi:hypothetical protein
MANSTRSTQLLNIMNDYFSDALGIDPDFYPGEDIDEDEEEEREERHPSLTAAERNA